MKRLLRIVLAVLAACVAQPAFAQTGAPMCYDSTRAAYYPRPVRAGDSLITAARTATTVCVKPLHRQIQVRVGDRDTIVVQPGSEIGVPITAEPGVAALKFTLTFTASRLQLVFDGVAHMQWVSPWSGAMNPATRVVGVYAPTASATATIARAWFVVRPTTGRTNVSITALTEAFDERGASVLSRMIVRNLVVCVVQC